MLSAIAIIICLCFALAIGLLVFGAFTWATRKGKGDVVAAVFAITCGFIFAYIGGWTVGFFRDMFIRLSGR